MRVLGINGWPGASHDASACLLVDGAVVAFAEEERFIRRKHAYGAAPYHAAAYCLAEGGLAVDDLDAVAHGWNLPELFQARGLEWPASDAECLELLLPRDRFPRRRDPRLVFVPHHLAHAASAYHLSGHDRAAILVVDGQGEDESATLARGAGGKIEVLRTVPVAWSLGYFYEAVCRYVGLGPDTAGKLMGLAAHGTVREPSFGTFHLERHGYAVDALPADLRSIGATDEEQAVIGRWLAHLEEVLDLPPNPRTVRFEVDAARFVSRPGVDPYEYRDVAATAQEALEQAVMALVDGLLAETGETTLHLAGGVGYNATLNGKLLRSPGVRDFFVQPLAGDLGVSLGAAAHVAAEEGDLVQPLAGSLAFGPQWTPGAIRRVLDRAGLRYSEPADIAQATADLVASGAVVGWFQGRGEGGPRALGHRSLLAAPSTTAMRERINLAIKGREWWRPLAASLHEAAAAALLEAERPLPYMIVTTRVREDAAPLVPAIVHVDGTTRPQTVAAGTDPLYHRLLERAGERSGLPLVLNTSFNGRDEPLVWTPTDALVAFARLGLDALALGPFLLQKDLASIAGPRVSPR